jgi:hypothetical protein
LPSSAIPVTPVGGFGGASVMNVQLTGDASGVPFEDVIVVASCAV